MGPSKSPISGRLSPTLGGLQPTLGAATSNQVVKMNTGYCLNGSDTVDPRAITILQSRAEIHKTEILQERNIQSGHSLKDPYR